MKVSVLGATGLVGETIMRVLAERGHEGIAVGRKERVETEIALSALPAEAAAEIIPSLLKRGIRVVDNSSAFRMDLTVPLVIPELNAHHIGYGHTRAQLVASPNCVVIQLLLGIQPLRLVTEHVVISTYQALSGAGRDALIAGLTEVDPVIGQVYRDGWTDEERKIRSEAHKVASLKVSATCARVPVNDGHGISATLFLDRHISDPASYFDEWRPVINTDRVSVRRVRVLGDKIVGLWIDADNLRKGAATNVVQIAELL